MIGRCVLLLLIASAANGETADDPNKTITIVWDMLGMTTWRCTVCVLITGQIGDHKEWRVGWTWLGDEVIWSSTGAKAMEQGCRGFSTHNLPESCGKSPTMVYSGPFPMNTPSATNMVSFYLVVGNPVDVLNYLYIRVPGNFTFVLGLSDYICGHPVKNPTTEYGRDQTNRPHTSWNVTCRVLPPAAPHNLPEDKCSVPMALLAIYFLIVILVHLYIFVYVLRFIFSNM